MLFVLLYFFNLVCSGTHLLSKENALLRDGKLKVVDSSMLYLEYIQFSTSIWQLHGSGLWVIQIIAY